MTDLTPDRLQELRRIAEAATPGPRAQEKRSVIELQSIAIWINWADESQNFVEAVEGISQEDAAKYLLMKCGDETCVVVPMGDKPHEISVHDHDESEKCDGERCSRIRRVTAWEFEMYERGDLEPEELERTIALRAPGGATDGR